MNHKPDDRGEGLKETKSDNAAVIAPPHLIFAVFLASGLLLHWAFPVSFMSHELTARLVIASPLLAVSAVLALLSRKAMRRGNTPINPAKPTSAIVVAGPFRFTRNPLYVSLFLLYGGIALVVNASWPIALFPAMFVVFRFGVVSREEKYLERKFGEEYLQYKKRVRRWV